MQDLVALPTSSLLVDVGTRVLELAVVGGVVGVLNVRYRVALVLGAVIAFSALISSVLGFGVEARLRLSVVPLLFLLTGLGLSTVFSLYRHHVRPTPLARDSSI